MWIKRASWVDGARTLAKVMPPRYAFSWHTDTCVKKSIALHKEYLAWAEKYPYYCRSCGGSGGTCWDENQSPLGSGQYWPQTHCDICSCLAPMDIEEMSCPRCSERLYDWIASQYVLKPGDEWLAEKYGDDGKVEAWLEKSEHCPFCKWEHGYGRADIVPEPLGECGCYYSSTLPSTSAIPTGLQAWMFKHLGTVGQRIFRYPVKILRRKPR